MPGGGGGGIGPESIPPAAGVSQLLMGTQPGAGLGGGGPGITLPQFPHLRSRAVLPISTPPPQFPHAALCTRG